MGSFRQGGEDFEDLFAGEMPGNQRDRETHEEEQGEHAVDENRRSEMVCARRQAREGKDHKVHQDVNERAVEKTARDGVARKEAKTHCGDEEERRPEERDGVVDGKPKRRHGRPTVESGHPEKTTGNEPEEASSGHTAEAVEDERVGDVERAGDEQTE